MPLLIVDGVPFYLGEVRTSGDRNVVLSVHVEPEGKDDARLVVQFACDLSFDQMNTLKRAVKAVLDKGQETAPEHVLGPPCSASAS